MTDLIRREDAIRSAMSVPVFSPSAAQSEINIAVLVLAKVDTALRSLPAAPDPRDEVIRRLMEALEPFADAPRGNYSYQSDALCISMGHGKDDLRWCLPLGDFRRARATLTFAKEQLK